MGLVPLGTCGWNQTSSGKLDAPYIIGESLETGYSPIWRLASRSGQWNGTEYLTLSSTACFPNWGFFSQKPYPFTHSLSFHPDSMTLFLFPLFTAPLYFFSVLLLMFFSFCSSLPCSSLIGHDRKLKKKNLLLLVEFIHKM